MNTVLKEITNKKREKNCNKKDLNKHEMFNIFHLFKWESIILFSK